MGSAKYDGTEKTVTGYDVAIDNELYTENDFTFSGNDVIKATDADIYNMELKPSDFNNISHNFAKCYLQNCRRNSEYFQTRCDSD